MIKWHASLHERLIRTGQNNAQNDQKWGYFNPSQQYNVNQSPLPFSYECRKTYESTETDKKSMGESVECEFRQKILHLKYLL